MAKCIWVVSKNRKNASCTPQGQPASPLKMPRRKTRRCHFWDPKFQNFLGEHAPRTPYCKRLWRLGKIYSRAYIFKIPRYAPDYCSWVLHSMDCLQLPFIREEKAVSWSQRFLTRNVYIWPTNGSLFMTNKFESNCVQKFDVSSK